jgi:uncharacterized membrane protein
MNGRKTILESFQARQWRLLVLVAISLGLLFRLANLDAKVYWVDEVATSIRIAGFTRHEVAEQLVTSSPLSVSDLQRYQRLSPNRDWSDTFQALSQSPEHSPFYFLLARLWSQLFGSSVMAIRSLSVLFSLLALPTLYWLYLELFRSSLTAWMGLILFFLSPVFVAYAQEARPYSLWVLTLVLLSGGLLRALRRNTPMSWGGYTIALVLSLYTSLLSGFVAIGEVFYVLLREGLQFTSRLRRFLVATGVALLAFTPWLLIIANHWGMLQDNTTWMRNPIDSWALMGIWLYNLAVLFFDVPVSIDPSLATLAKVVIALTVIALIAYSFYFLFSKTSQAVWLFVFALAGTTFLALILLDLIFNGQLSTAARYMMPCYLGIQMAIAYLLTHRIYFAVTVAKQQAWRVVALGLISLSLFSCLSHLQTPSKYQKSRNLSNQPIASLLNQADSPTLIATPDQTLDIISLSYLLKPDIKIEISPAIHFESALKSCRPLFLFNPSESLIKEIQKRYSFHSRQIYRPERLAPSEIALSLWKIERSRDCPATKNKD